jgi:putative ABC transport system ATP-binding protein
MLLELDNLGKQFAGPSGAVTAVDGASLSLSGGEFLAIRGPSGCGKSTLLLSAGALLTPTSGAVRIDGQDVYQLASEQRCRLRAGKIGFVFQQFHLIPYLSVLDNVLSPTLAGAGDSGVGAAERAGQLLKQLGMAERAHHVPAQLSIGECQRTALARAMLNGPRLILADEPTGNLDDANARAVLECLADFARSGGSVLMVTHDEKVCDYATRRLSMAAGKIVG